MSESSPNYTQLKLLGQGQYGRVFLARHRTSEELVALKQLTKQCIPTKLFLRELSFLVRLRHPNLVAFQGLEHHGHHRYLVLDYCDGGNLREFLASDRPLTLDHRLGLVADVLEGLHYLHHRQIIHRDLKPENILLASQAEGWQARITDFGIARLFGNNQGTELEFGDTGSPAYMAPERFYGNYSMASDIYGVGVLLYELVVGQRPFAGNPKEMIYAHLNQPLQLSNTIPFPLKSTISKALHKLPQRRFPNAQAMLRSLQLARNILQSDKALADSPTASMTSEETDKTHSTSQLPAS